MPRDVGIPVVSRERKFSSGNGGNDYVSDLWRPPVVIASFIVYFVGNGFADTRPILVPFRESKTAAAAAAYRVSRASNHHVIVNL